jgi:prepilin-type N-terminal cleavage/methylation domain-containing protein
MSTRCHSDKGFTLIELLVTISIIALLIALLLPVMAKARTVASTAVCLTNQRSIFLSARLHAADRRNYYPITLNSYSAYYAGSDASNPVGYYGFAAHLNKGGYFVADNGAQPGLRNPAARCPERRGNFSTMLGAVEYAPNLTGSTWMDFITSNLTGTPRAQLTMQAWDPWSSPVNNTFWFHPRNPYPANQSDLGRYGPYMADDIPPRKMLLADAPMYNRTSPYTTLYPPTQSVSGGWFDIPGGMTMLNTGGTGPTVIEDNLIFPLHNGGFNGMFFDGSGKYISGSIATPTTTVLTIGSSTPSYQLWNLFRWTPRTPPTSGQAGYVPAAAFPAGFPANNGF